MLVGRSGCSRFGQAATPTNGGAIKCITKAGHVAARERCRAVILDVAEAIGSNTTVILHNFTSMFPVRQGRCRTIRNWVVEFGASLVELETNYPAPSAIGVPTPIWPSGHSIPALRRPFCYLPADSFDALRASGSLPRCSRRYQAIRFAPVRLLALLGRPAPRASHRLRLRRGRRPGRGLFVVEQQIQGGGGGRSTRPLDQVVFGL